MQLKFKRYLVNEKMSNGRYDYSSVQANLPKHLADRIIQWGDDNIKEEDIIPDPYGRETEIHVTLLYGIHANKSEEVKRIINKKKRFKIKLGKISIFDTNDKFDVIKIEAESRQLYEIHDDLKNKIDNSEPYPKYRPHVTIAYIKKGKCKNLTGNLVFANQDWLVKEIAFSEKNGDRHMIKLS